MAIGSDVISLRVQRETKDALEAAAKEAGTTLTDYLRALVEGAVTKERTGSAARLDELRELRRDVTAGFEVLGVLMCRMRKVSTDEEAKECERTFRQWIEENLRHAQHRDKD
jgi:hypothetical protein